VPGDPSLYVLFQVCPAGCWPAVLALTALAGVGPGGPFAAMIAAGIGNAVGAVVAGAVTAVAQFVFTCAMIAAAVVALLVTFFVLFATLAWMRDD
jgi:hypothetical protein